MTETITAPVDRARLTELAQRERATYLEHTPASAAASTRRSALLGGVPMTWMRRWRGPYPLTFERARGAEIVDLDGNEYVDFALGDTGAMAGHSPAPTVAAVRDRLEREGGIATMLPSIDAGLVGAELAARFGLPLWSFTLTATDANRFVLRFCRQLTGRSKILVFDGCYHGTVDETFATLDASGRVVASAGSVGPAVPVSETTRVVQFNDIEALRRELAHGDVACVLAEPALTNIGIVPPEPGFHEALRALCTEMGTLLVIDETHTFSCGYGGATRAWSLEPDVLTIGKSIAGGVPIGAYGLREDLGTRILADDTADLEDVGGIGGTLAGSALSLAAARATLADVLTEEAFAGMASRGERLARGLQAIVEELQLPWICVGLGARAELRYCSRVPRTGAESSAADDPEIDDYYHLAMLNRGVLITPFHAMSLVSPATSDADVDQHLDAFANVAGALRETAG